MAALALIEVLDREGGARHSLSVQAWPLRVGRALDNDLVLDDRHTAAHHFTVEPDAAGQVQVVVGDTCNGVQLDSQQLAAGERANVGETPALLWAGRTRLRLRLAQHTLAPEQALLATRSLTQGWSTLGLLALATLLTLAAGTYLESEPEGLLRALGSLAIAAASGLLGWTALWTLLSRVFTHQGHFGWHVRVLLIAVLAWQAVTVLSELLAFAMSWPWVTDFSFVLIYLILGAMLYFHLQAVEPLHPLHPQRTRAFALSTVVLGVGLSLWFNWQGAERLGSELYMNHLFPPALRVARPVELGQFMDGVAALQGVLDEKAKKSADE